MSTHHDRLTALRDQLARLSLDGFVVPLTDEHMSEYVGGYAQRLAWLTGFQGSAGTAVVLADDAAIFTDGRYTLQVREQVSGDDWAFVEVPQASVAGWLADHAADGARIGYDPWLHTRAGLDDIRRALAERGGVLVPVAANPIDAVWPDRPAPSDARVTVHGDAVAGANSAAKRAGIADWLAEKRADAVVLSALDSIAWTLNVRGGDVDHTPVALAYAIVDSDGTTDLFVAPEKIDDAVRQHLGNAVRIHDRGGVRGRAGGLCGQARRRRSRSRGVGDLRRAGGGRRDRRPPARSGGAAKGAEERRRSVGPPRRLGTRRCRAHPFPALGRGGMPRRAARPNCPPPPGCWRCGRKAACCSI